MYYLYKFFKINVMKKSAALFLILAGIFVSTQLTAQEDSKTGQDLPAVKSSKTKPGTTSTDQSKTSQTGKSSSTSTQAGTMTSSGTAAQGNKIYDATGNLTYTVDQLGYIRNPKNRTLGQYTANGEYIRKRTVVGKAENGVIRDRYGKEYARIGQDGKVTDGNGKLLGSIGTDGIILDAKGVKIGSAPGVDKNITAIIFFLQDSSGTKKGKSSIK